MPSAADVPGAASAATLVTPSSAGFHETPFLLSSEAAGGGAPQPPTSEFTALMMMASDMLQPMPDRRPSAYEVENGLKALAKRSGDALGQRDADSEYDGDDDSMMIQKARSLSFSPFCVSSCFSKKIFSLSTEETKRYIYIFFFENFQTLKKDLRALSLSLFLEYISFTKHTKERETQ